MMLFYFKHGIIQQAAARASTRAVLSTASMDMKAFPALIPPAAGMIQSPCVFTNG